MFTRSDSWPAAAVEQHTATGSPRGTEVWPPALVRLYEERLTSLTRIAYLLVGRRDIAEVLGCEPGTVRTLVHRGLKDLRKEIER